MELWENVLAQRRAFRALPPERLRKEDYFSADPNSPDHTYAFEGAVIEGYEFDRVAFRIVGSTFRSADLAHWLALDVAARALADAGFPDGRGLPREATGVLLGNTLTGEFSRANTLRLRWPFVRRIVESALAREGWTAETRLVFLNQLETEYKSPFPATGEETLAGGLSNTIAGRICNQFDLKGGGYTVDGACASSLLAVANACSSLAAGDLDVALAGGVDLSLDPFELVGFAKTGALAPEDMRVFDRRSAGFWPGEGCGFVTLMRHEDALAQGRRVYAVIRGWGISSDGSGGITRPEAEGQLEALRRAYRRAGFGPDTVAYCEGHGTGTAVGDATELEVLSRARREAKSGAPVAVVGSVKANIGHTKAAAGIAGLIKATMAVHTQVLPPTTGCGQPHALLTGPAPALRVLREAEMWPADQPLRASVSAMGFGGINAHVVLEGTAGERRAALAPVERSLSHSHQDAELFLLSAQTSSELDQQVDTLLALAGRVSRAELADLAACLQKRLGNYPVRAALVAAQPAQLAARLQTLKSWLQDGVAARLQFSDGVFLGTGTTTPRLAFLFPGQGAPTHLDGGIWQRRFDPARELYARTSWPGDADSTSTRVMQPAVVTASLAGLKVLETFGLTASAAIGHSLGEITALHWAGAFDEAALLRIATVRGAAMADLGGPTGAMLAVAAPAAQVETVINGDPLEVVGFNSPRQTVIAGEVEAVNRFTERATAHGWEMTRLRVSHAFHTPLVAAAVPVLAEQLARENLTSFLRPVVSTITGGPLGGHEDVRALLCQQVTSPVRFAGALAALPGAAGKMDLLVEVGPGAILTGLARDITDVPVVSLDAGGASLVGLLQTLGAAFALGAPVRTAALFDGRFVRPFSLDWQPEFFANPCEQAPVLTTSDGGRSTTVPVVRSGGKGTEYFRRGESSPVAATGETPAATPLDLIRKLVAERAELPVAAVQGSSRMLSNLHLNSITVGQLVAEAARQLGLAPLVGLTEFANASVAEIARALTELKAAGGTARRDDRKRPVPGVDSWVRAFSIESVEVRAPSGTSRRGRSGSAAWQLFAPKNHPLAAVLRDELTTIPGGGVVVCLPPNPNEDHLALLLDAGRAVLALESAPRFVLVQHGWGGSGFARTLHQETPGLTTCIVNLPAAHPQACAWVVLEVAAASGFTEMRYTAEGRRLESRLKLVSLDPAQKEICLGSDDVLLVTGGGKGIAAECALTLARDTGARLALLGRSDPATDRELLENLARIQGAGVRCCYVRADVTDAKAVRAAVTEAVKKVGPVTAILHGAGRNEPQLIRSLDEETFRRTVAPKVQGARNVLAAVNTKSLRMFVTFSSIIARAGLPGEADYATANEWLTALTEEFQAQHPQCRCLALEWSVWSGVGMGERLGRIESLVQQDIMPITPGEGVRMCCELINTAGMPTALVVSGRFGDLPTMKLAQTEWPLQRFLERPRIFYPGVELVVDAELSVAADPYLNDHAMQGTKLFPAVFGLEAMAQAAMAVTGSQAAPSFERVELLRPVAVSDKAPLTIRIAALRRGDDLVEVCLRSGETDFQIDHFRAICRFGATPDPGERLELAPVAADALPLEARGDLYGRILFHEGRFRRVLGYRLLQAKECVAEIAPDDGAPWFGPYLPTAFVLGDPGARDATIHAIQACIPHLRILPTGVDRLVILRRETGARFVRAQERRREGNNFFYDVEVTNARGELLERWEGLRLRGVEALETRAPWPGPLLAPYVERRLEEQLASVAVVFGNATGEAAMQQALRTVERIWRRPDGRPLAETGNVSAAHSQNFTLAVAGGGRAACDLETVSPRPGDVWRDLLGAERFKLAGRIALERTEDIDTAATRLWTALECLKKADCPVTTPLILEATTEDGWVLLRAGSLTVATCAVAVREAKGRLVVAVLTDSTAALAKPAALTGAVL